MLSEGQKVSCSRQLQKLVAGYLGCFEVLASGSNTLNLRPKLHIIVLRVYVTFLENHALVSFAIIFASALSRLRKCYDKSNRSHVIGEALFFYLSRTT